MIEKWKTIDGFKIYQVSNFGQVRRTTFHKWGRGLSKYPGFILGQRVSRDGYKRAILYANRKRYNRLVHLLVSTTFIGKKPFGLETNHIDGIKQNNHVSNLEYITKSQNRQHAKKLLGAYIGSNNGRAKLTETDVLNIKQELKLWTGVKGKQARSHPSRFYSVTAIAKRYQVSPNAISFIKNNKHWTHVNSN